MKKVFLSLIMLLLIPAVFAGTASRSFSKTTASSGETVTITYTASQGNWALKEKLPTGCVWMDGSAESPDGFVRSFVSGTTFTHKVACTSTAAFNLAEYCVGCGADPYTKFPSQTLTISSGTQTCTGSSTEACMVGECSGTRSRTCVSGTWTGWSECVKTNPSCGSSTCTDSCSSKGYECGTASICGSSIDCGTCSEGFECKSNACVATTPKEPFDVNACLVGDRTAEVDTFFDAMFSFECLSIPTIVLIVGILFLLSFLK